MEALVNRESSPRPQWTKIHCTDWITATRLKTL